jgi:hypothetical protein
MWKGLINSKRYERINWELIMINFGIFVGNRVKIKKFVRFLILSEMEYQEEKANIDARTH